MRLTRLSAWLLPLCLAFPALGQHVHGHATLNVALEGQDLEAELEVPADDVVGFEHAPKTDADKSAVATALARLKDANALFDLPTAAECKLVDAEAEHELEDHGHSAFHAHYHWTCTKPDAMQGFGTRIFVHFPSLSEVEAVAIGPNGQKAQELEPDAPAVVF